MERSSSALGVATVVLGFERSEDEGLDRGTLLGCWGCGLLGIWASGGGSLTTQTVRIRAIFPSSFFGMVGFSIMGQVLNSSSDISSVDGASNVLLNYLELKLMENILIMTPANSRIFHLLSDIVGLTALVPS